MINWFSIFILTIALPLTLQAEQIHEVNYSVRAMGMGNAFSTLARDSDALFYNPAALGKNTTISLNLAQINAGVNGMNAYESIMSASEIDSIEDYSSLYGDYLWLGFGGRASVTMPRFGVAYYTGGYLDLELQSPSMPELDGGYIFDQGIVIGGAFKLWDGAYLGISGKRVVRQGGEEVIGLGTIAGGDFEAIQNEFTAKGIGYGLDVGFLMEVEGDVETLFSLVLKDVGHTKFVFEGSTDPPPPSQKSDLTAGIGFVKELPLVTLKTAVDVKHLLDDDHQFGKKLHLGTEIDMPMFDVRAGFNQGYYTLGLGMDFLFFRFDAITYGVERGVYPGQIEDRKYDLELSMGFSIDADFNFSGLAPNGGSSRVKHRR